MLWLKYCTAWLHFDFRKSSFQSKTFVCIFLETSFSVWINVVLSNLLPVVREEQYLQGKSVNKDRGQGNLHGRDHCSPNTAPDMRSRSASSYDVTRGPMAFDHQQDDDVGVV